jgi:hypothetical protein
MEGEIVNVVAIYGYYSCRIVKGRDVIGNLKKITVPDIYPFLHSRT